MFCLRAAADRLLRVLPGCVLTLVIDGEKVVYGNRKNKRASCNRIPLRVLVAAAAAWLLPLPLAQAQSQHEYTSDYFSFVGRDKNGLVAFAMDNNRGRAADRYQAEHFLKLYDQLQGWVAIKGNGDYINAENQLERIPDSADFSFNGDAETGLRIHSPSNAIALSISPVPKMLFQTNQEGTYWMGAAPATLRWRERIIQGRVIYEYLHWNRFNRLVGKSPGVFRNFNGLYLMVAEGSDFYFHQRENERLQLSGKQLGFATWNGAAPLDDVDFHITEYGFAPGFYRWPTTWTGRFRYQGTAYRFELKTVDRAVERNWVIGGFAMAIVEGEITSADGLQHLTVFGLAELIM